MSKLVDFAVNALCALGSALLCVAAWGTAEAFMEVPAPVTPLMWICAALFAFCTGVYGMAALVAPFRKA
jgi:TRAP-type C4-dicarboxylate transport system permease small subunit